MQNPLQTSVRRAGLIQNGNFSHLTRGFKFHQGVSLSQAPLFPVDTEEASPITATIIASLGFLEVSHRGASEPL